MIAVFFGNNAHSRKLVFGVAATCMTIVGASMTSVAVADTSMSKDGTINDYGATSCPGLYESSTPPVVIDKISDGSIEHCHPNNVSSFDNMWVFSNLISPVTHGPIYAAELLTDNNVRQAKGVSRKGITFFNDPSVPMNYQGQTGDYTRSGYDRGHMANWADGADPQTFELTNIVPQDANNNRQLWEKIETATRKAATGDGAVYVISGPVYGPNPAHLKNSSDILVPDYLFKCVSSTSYHGCAIVKNGPGWDWELVSYNYISSHFGIDPFPASNYKDSTTFPQVRDGRTAVAPTIFQGDFHAGPTGDSDQSVGTSRGYSEEGNAVLKKEVWRLGKKAVRHYSGL